MDETRQGAFQVIDQKGVRGTLDLTIAPPQGSDSRLVLVRFDDGSQIFADAGEFTEREEGVFSFPGDFAQLLAQNSARRYGAVPFGSVGQIVIPLVAEELNVTRERILTGGVRVRKTIEERTETIDEPTLREDVSVERIAVNEFVAEAPAVRYEGDVTIVPLLEEVLVVEKRLVLREEIRISKRRETVRNPQQIVVRREQATLESISPDAAGADAAPNATGETQTSAKE